MFSMKNGFLSFIATLKMLVLGYASKWRGPRVVVVVKCRNEARKLVCIIKGSKSRTKGLALKK